MVRSCHCVCRPWSDHVIVCAGHGQIMSLLCADHGQIMSLVCADHGQIMSLLTVCRPWSDHVIVCAGHDQIMSLCVQAMIRGDLEVLKDWCHEAVSSVATYTLTLVRGGGVGGGGDDSSVAAYTLTLVRGGGGGGMTVQ